MRKYLLILAILILPVIGCNKPKEAVTADEIVPIEDAIDPETPEEIIPVETETDVETITDTKTETEKDTEEDTKAAVETDTDTKPSDDKPEIVWIGDSLTQGSLGEDNHNQDNPQAPWRVLRTISGKRVEGVGFYGYITHDIFWAYGEYNGIKDPDIIYVYWVGSNDFYQSVDNVDRVIEETDHFNESAGITKFLFLGTTNRKDMDPEAYIPINKALEEKYGDKYLDIMPYVEYGTDGIHLTEESYAKVANAVNDKLNELYY